MKINLFITLILLITTHSHSAEVLQSYTGTMRSNLPAMVVINPSTAKLTSNLYNFNFSPAIVNTPLSSITSSKTFTITNTGNIPGLINSAPSITTFMPVSPAPTTFDMAITTNTCTANLLLNPGASCNITVKFAPTAIGIRQNKILLNYNNGADNQTLIIQLSGLGLAASTASITPNPAQILEDHPGWISNPYEFSLKIENICNSSTSCTNSGAITLDRFRILSSGNFRIKASTSNQNCVAVSSNTVVQSFTKVLNPQESCEFEITTQATGFTATPTTLPIFEIRYSDGINTALIVTSTASVVPAMSTNANIQYVPNIYITTKSFTGAIGSGCTDSATKVFTLKNLAPNSLPALIKHIELDFVTGPANATYVIDNTGITTPCIAGTTALGPGLTCSFGIKMTSSQSGISQVPIKVTYDHDNNASTIDAYLTNPARIYRTDCTLTGSTPTSSLAMVGTLFPLCGKSEIQPHIKNIGNLPAQLTSLSFPTYANFDLLQPTGSMGQCTTSTVLAPNAQCRIRVGVDGIVLSQPTTENITINYTDTNGSHTFLKAFSIHPACIADPSTDHCDDPANSFQSSGVYNSAVACNCNNTMVGCWSCVPVTAGGMTTYNVMPNPGVPNCP